MKLSSHVLVVDASDVSVSRLTSELRRSGQWEIFRAKTFPDALEWTVPVPDVVLLDLRLPGGPQPDELVRRVSEHFRLSAIVLVVGLQDERIAERCFEAGAHDYFLPHLMRGDTLDRKLRHAMLRKSRALQDIEDSRADMKIDAETLAKTVGAAVDRALEQRFKRDVVPRLQQVKRAVGAEDTDVFQVGDAPDADAQLKRQIERLYDRITSVLPERDRERALLSKRELERLVEVRPPRKSDAFRRFGVRHPVLAELGKIVIVVASAIATAVGTFYESVLETNEAVHRIEAQLQSQRIGP